MDLCRLSPLATAVLLAVGCATAQAQLNYTSVSTDQGWNESYSGQALSMPSMGGLALVTADSLSVVAGDSTHWVGGPFVAASRAFQFGVAGAQGTFETITATVAIEAHYGNDLAYDFTASHGFEAALTGWSGVSGIGGGLVEVNCLGCGGHLGGGTITGTDGLTIAWPHDFQATVSFSALVERGWNQAGSFRMNGYVGVGSTWADLSIDLLSLTDSQGRTLVLGDDGFLAPVPEPGTAALWLAGVAVTGALARRRRA